ncbi:MAG TPA: DUF1080 domain-containing protein [Flavobacteriaceae bacterium]|nr:DUF1080 domain-containing protein [Flavobacteriaceae bacterium]MCB9212107.1 DUF1080 domain-containing protein [Alteromonas sp.]HPF10513.1 DUF1080 domain-containing protein [Flavobacteriaceae bacterium]HQU22090.1 DUF1080 domain-containing protein [Flavobacteriaceae bacterium]HQU66083.1 DUF1080 domain-containing protein [Flavobacteriaceae bacterium]
MHYKTVTVIVLVTLLWGCKNPEGNPKEGEPASDTLAVAMETPTETWEVLFNGSSFDHWRGFLKEGMPPGWSIEAGAMSYTPGDTHGNDIISKDTYTNFILSLEWKISEGGNSGIFWGVHEDAEFEYPYQTGPEIQVLDDEKHPDSFVGEGTHKAGALYDMIAPAQSVVKPAGEWNLCIIEVDHNANKGMVSLNGTIIVEFPVQGAEWDALVENSKFKGWKGFGIYPTGHLALQDHGNQVWFRDIKIKRLPD